MGTTVHNFNLYLKNPHQQKQEEEGYGLGLSGMQPPSRDPKNEFRRATDRPSVSMKVAPQPVGITTSQLQPNASRNAASKSFDLDMKSGA